jgi:hypothetical protein
MSASNTRLRYIGSRAIGFVIQNLRPKIRQSTRYPWMHHNPDTSGYLDVPYDLRRPPITRVELERARTILTQKGERHPTEDQIFATTAAQRRIEDAARQRTRMALRNAERRPGMVKAAKTSRPKATVDYSRPAIPYEGEEW